MKVERTRDAQAQRIDRQKANRPIFLQSLPARGRSGDIITVPAGNNIHETYVFVEGQWIQISQNAEIARLKGALDTTAEDLETTQTDLETTQTNLNETAIAVRELADMANVPVALSFIVENDSTFTFDANDLASGYDTLRENQENVVDIAAGVQAHFPSTTSYSIAETTDANDALTSVGLSMTGTAGDGASSVTVTPNDDGTVDALYLHLTTATVDANQNITVTLTAAQPD